MAATCVKTPGPQSTIDPAMAGRESWDAIVIGGGLAGSISARGLAMAGHRTLLVERTSFPRSKVCGCCLNDLATSTLDAIGLGDLLSSCGARNLEEVHLFAGSRPTRVPMHGVVGLSREVLDARLATEAVDAGAELLLEARAEADPDGTVRVDSRDGRTEMRARVVILASGLLSHEKEELHRRTRGLVGLGAVVPDRHDAHPGGVVGMVIDRAGYVGIAPLEDGRLTIASAIRADAIKNANSPKDAVESILRKADMAHLVEADTRFVGVPTLRRKRRALENGCVHAVGDAAGFVEPITGEGMSWAMATGAAVVPCASAFLEKRPGAIGWERTYRRMMRKRHLRCAFVGACIRRPGLVRSAVVASALLPMMRAPVLSGLLGRFDPSIEGELA